MSAVRAITVDTAADSCEPRSALSRGGLASRVGHSAYRIEMCASRMSVGKVIALYLFIEVELPKKIHPLRTFVD